MTRIRTGPHFNVLRVLETRYCQRCGGEREFAGRRMPHLRHLGLTIVTFGLWGIGWLAMTIAVARRPWRCTICGSRAVPASAPSAPADSGEWHGAIARPRNARR
jgi:hypothetical protein